MLKHFVSTNITKCMEKAGFAPFSYVCWGGITTPGHFPLLVWILHHVTDSMYTCIQTSSPLPPRITELFNFQEWLKAKKIMSDDVTRISMEKFPTYSYVNFEDQVLFVVGGTLKSESAVLFIVQQ